MSAPEKLHVEPFVPPARLQRTLLVLAAVGIAIFAVGAFVSPARAWSNLLMAGAMVLALSMGALFFMAVTTVARGGWATAFRRVPEAMVQSLPLAAVMLLCVLAGGHYVYEWTHHNVMQADEVLRAKAAYLNLPFFAGRAVVIFAGWILFARAMINQWRLQDQDHAESHTHSAVKIAAVFLVFFAISFSVATWDWLMSIEPHWFSTIFSVYHFAGTFTAGLAGIIVLAIALRRMGPLRNVLRDEHLHDLGKMLFAFCTFWAYIWVSQYLLTWYSNLGEETGFFQERMRGGWGTLFYLDVVLNWLLPFVVLLPRNNKRSEKTLLRVALVVLVGHWLDLYVIVMPVSMGSGPTFHLWEIGPMLAGVSLFVYFTLRNLARAPLVPTGDPTLGESLGYHN